MLSQIADCHPVLAVTQSGDTAERLKRACHRYGDMRVSDSGRMAYFIR